MAEHIFAVSGNGAAARRRILEARELIGVVVAEPGLGTTLDAPLDGWRVRHGGRNRRITVVFRHDAASDALYIALIAFGGRDWGAHVARRSEFGGNE
ncbi:type II toxin-antitoxin system RelE/ParE family toxin [uncultured Jannaschia sp.]|uniref:type II toxin-antitoxin system RelE/ParE family toxin n=1 Tax=uncultured Jannaschia sp. TaxID=293347 RepID=UPI0026245F9C|nr:type II toxin-antitoxin system RelE/ParE family toxin [uncultured Jannaschia sp.]